MKQIAVTVFMPIYNEEHVIKDIVTNALKYLNSKIKTYELILVNDGSFDNTLKIINKLAKDNKNIKVVSHKTNSGYGEAIKSGLKHAKNNWVLFLDSDGQFTLDSLVDFLKFTKNSDLVIGYRIKRNDNFHRHILSGVYKKLVRALFGLNVKDIDCAFKLMRKDKIQKLDLKSSSFFISTELLCKAQKMGYRIVELPVKHYPRSGGKSSVNFKRSFHSLIELIKLFRSL